MLEFFPTTRVGRSLLVAKEDLQTFLDQIHDADDPLRCLAELRQKPHATSTKKLRVLVTKDAIAATLDSLPNNLKLDPGRIEVTFETVEQLALALYGLAQILEGELDEFAKRYEPKVEREESSKEEAADIKVLFDALKQLEDKEASVRY
jgi:hypothetical protein